MAIAIDTPHGVDALTQFILFHDEVYQRTRTVRWSAVVPFQLPMLLGDSPFCEDRTLRPFAAREGGRMVARVVAVVDRRYQRHWNERLGHVVLYEALPDARAATRAVMDAACEWLAAEGAVDARAGSGLLEFPFVIDDHEKLPPVWLRQNPAYYHALLKDAGFETEQGWVDYKIAVTPQLVERWTSALEAVRRGGFEIVPLKDVPESDRAHVFTALWNETFRAHWGYTPFSEAEMVHVMQAFAVAGMFETSVVAYRDRQPLGALWVVPETTMLAAVDAGRTLAPDEKLNVLGIGVREAARGRGVNTGMAAFAYLELARRGATHVSYTLVLDHNWPSRRTAEKLGAAVCANYVTYRRRFARVSR